MTGTDRLTTSRLADPTAVHDAAPRASCDTLGISGMVSAFDAAIGVSGLPTDDEGALTLPASHGRQSSAGDGRFNNPSRCSLTFAMGWRCLSAVRLGRIKHL